MLISLRIEIVLLPGLSKEALLAQLEPRHGAGGLAALPRDVQRNTLEGALSLHRNLCRRTWVVVPAGAFLRC